MEPALKQRLVGAAVLVALAVIFLPMLVQGPAPDSGAADVPLDMPDAPAGEFQTRELPLVVPAGPGAGGAVEMEGSAPVVQDRDAAEVAEAAIIEEAPATPPAAQPASRPAPSQEQDGSGGMFPAATASGDYAVSFGSYSTAAAADKVVASLRGSQLPGFRETARVAGKTWHRVRIGPYATRAEAEAARLRAAHVRDDVGARVVVLSSVSTQTAAAPATATAPAPAPATRPAASAPAAADTGFAVQLAAFGKAADAIELRDRARAAGFSAFTEAVNTDDGTLTRVRVGPVMTREQAEQLRDQVRAKLGIDGVVRSHP